MSPRTVEQNVTIAGRSLRISNLDKVLYPETGTTKGEVLAYYAQVARVLVPQAARRPATRKRWVNGVGTKEDPGKVFFRKHLEDSAPQWVPRGTITHKDHKNTYPLIDDAAVLSWLGQLAALEIHVPQWRFDQDMKPARPDRLVLDLDPGPGVDLAQCAQVALMCREVLEGMDLVVYPVTSGSKGIHLYAGLDGKSTADEISQVARELARSLQADHPEQVVADMKRSLREGKVFIDWSQNNGAKTTICPYSLRGTMRPTVAAPRTWEEIADPELRHLEFEEILGRVGAGIDPISPLGWKGEPRADRLRTYRSMRNAESTPEPVPKSAPEMLELGHMANFVIQEHHARALHWDFRLEHDGVLVSWAVPKGPPLKTGLNRLAVMTEDHPLDYGSFHGTIPAGQYGAGTVEIWDSGECTIEKWREGSEVIAVLRGRPDGGLKGIARRYALIHAPRMGSEKNWLLQLMKDQPRDFDAVTGEQNEKPPDRKQSATRVPRSSTLLGEMREPALGPMLATAGRPEDLDVQEKWSHEMKWDGFRAIFEVIDGKVVMHSRNGNDFTEQFPELQEIARLAPDGAVLDGEIVALDGAGRPNFGLLQNRLGGVAKGDAVTRAKPSQIPVHAMLFDALRLPANKTNKPKGKAGETEELTRLPYVERRSRLIEQVQEGKHVHIPPAHDGTVEQAQTSSAELGLEGVVSKRVDSIYLPGKRTQSWIKLKHEHHQEVVVIGWRQGNGSRKDSFGSLLLAIHVDGELHYAGRVGTGFSATALRQARSILELHTRKTPAAKDVPKIDRTDATWVSPRLVGEVQFTERTKDGRLRHPVWRGWRTDKEPAEVHWEI
jgi:bifunctional non-homologous end joining protein LigD